MDKPKAEIQPLWIRITLAVLVVSVVLVVAGGYFWWTQEQPRKPAELTKLTFAISLNPIASVGHIAFIKGFFKDEGLDVTLQFHTSGKASLNSVIERKANLATVADTPLAHAGLNKESIYILATIEDSVRSTAIVARKDKRISEPGDLKGKKIGATIGSSGEFMLDTFLVLKNISREQVEIIDLKPEEMADALLTGKVDAVTTWPPYRFRAENIIGHTTTTFFATGMYTETFNLAASRDFVDQNPETVKRILRSAIKAEVFMRKNPDQSRALIANHLKIDRSLIDELWKILNFDVRLDQSLLTTLENQARWAIKNKHTDKTEVPNYLEFMFVDGLRAVRPDMVTVIGHK
jgi:NitT/TauT family transport system substrate-binding protein